MVKTLRAGAMAAAVSPSPDKLDFAPQTAADRASAVEGKGGKKGIKSEDAGVGGHLKMSCCWPKERPGMEDHACVSACMHPFTERPTAKMKFGWKPISGGGETSTRQPGYLPA